VLKLTIFKITLVQLCNFEIVIREYVPVCITFDIFLYDAFLINHRSTRKYCHLPYCHPQYRTVLQYHLVVDYKNTISTTYTRPLLLHLSLSLLSIHTSFFSTSTPPPLKRGSDAKYYIRRVGYSVQIVTRVRPRD
jgi:hypothetical protein